jgi:rhamnose utilization protein RhaD (predicted bifunctional aldolase and dehydrogenase)
MLVGMDLGPLVELSRALAAPEEDCAILGEGNTSQRVSEATFVVKASGRAMQTIDEKGFVEMPFASILQALDGPSLSDVETAALLGEVNGLKPSTEAFMHAYLLSLPGVSFVGHTHPTPLLSLLCLDECEKIRDQRLFPDEIVCCGPSACLVPYAGPGLDLARAIRSGVQSYVQENGFLPQTIWIRNHGLICIGSTASEVLTATRMSVKAARIWLGALQTGMDIVTLPAHEVARIHTRADEHYRQRLLWQVGGS